MGVHSVVWLCWLHDRRDDAPVQAHPKALDSTRGQFLPDESQIWATSGVIKKPWGAGGGKTVDFIDFYWFLRTWCHRMKNPSGSVLYDESNQLASTGHKGVNQGSTSHDHSMGEARKPQYFQSRHQAMAKSNNSSFWAPAGPFPAWPPLGQTAEWTPILSQRPCCKPGSQD